MASASPHAQDQIAVICRWYFLSAGKLDSVLIQHTMPGTEVLEYRYWLWSSKIARINSLPDGTPFLLPHHPRMPTQPPQRSPPVIWYYRQSVVAGEILIGISLG